VRVREGIRVRVRGGIRGRVRNRDKSNSEN